MTIENLSTAELEQVLADRKKAEKQQRLEAKANYETEKDGVIKTAFEVAKEIAFNLKGFKERMHGVMDNQANKLAEYGGIRSSSKGGFSITSIDGNQRITRRRDTDPQWDERANKAVELIKSFLNDAVKKRDAKLHEILMGFLERNKIGDLEYSSVMELLKHENTFEDPRWKEGLTLIKESYSLAFKAYGYEFKYKTPEGKWETLTLNFSSL